MKDSKIQVSKLIDTKLHTRNDADKIYKTILDLQLKDVFMDFTDVNFISRSFADELCIVIDSLKKENKNIEMINVSSNIKYFFETVLMNRNNSKVSLVNTSVSVKHFSDSKSLSKFLLSI